MKSCAGAGSWRTKMKSHPDNDAEGVVTYGTGDVFADLGLELTPEERVKILIARQISRAIVERGLTQVEAARVLEIDQAKVSNLTRGRIAGFSVERLMKFVAALGWDIDIEMRPSGNERGRVRVHATDKPQDEEKLLA
jgi:predicted XRE-type DNA-binding protein